MPTILGNEPSRRETEEALRVRGNLALSGPDYVGKRTFACSLLEEEVGHQDLLVAEAGPDGAREAREFLSRLPALGPYRAVVVDEADRLSEAAQDSWLKLLEETPPFSTIVLVASDVDSLLPPLRSRLRRVVRWGRLSPSEVQDAVRSSGAEPEDAVVGLCRGLPGLYDVLRPPGFRGLFESVLSHVDGRLDPIFSPVPGVLEDLKSGRSPSRDAVSLVVRSAALQRVGSANREAVRSFLRFAAILVRVPSVNADIYWQRACLSRLEL